MGAICDCCAEPDGRQAIIVEEVEEIESVEGGCPRPIPLNLLPPSLARRVSVFDVNLALNYTNPTRQRGRPVPNSTVLGSRRPFAEGDISFHVMEHSEPSRRGTGLLVTGDLIFSTKIAGTARALGIEMPVVGSADAGLDRLSEMQPDCVILDLALGSLTVDQIQQIVRAAAGKAVLAFGSHVDTQRLEQA